MNNLDRDLLRLCEDYDIQKYLGKGGFASIYKARDKRDQKNVILNCLNKDSFVKSEKDQDLKQLKQRFMESEVTILMDCKSDHIIKCYDLLENQKWRILVVQYCQDGSLHSYLKIIKTMPQKQAIKIVSQLIMGFALLLKKKIIHRDLKTENILIHKGIYKIKSFGFAIVTNAVTKPSSNQILKKDLTMAPQLIQGQEYDASVDLWSLAVLYYQMLTGSLPFRKYPIKQFDITKLHDHIDSLSISQQSSSFLKGIFILNPEKRIKWLNVFKMWNAKTGLFSQSIRKPISQIKQKSPQRLSLRQIQSLKEQKQLVSRKPGFLKQPTQLIQQIQKQYIRRRSIKIQQLPKEQKTKQLQMQQQPVPYLGHKLDKKVRRIQMLTIIPQNKQQQQDKYDIEKLINNYEIITELNTQILTNLSEDNEINEIKNKSITLRLSHFIIMITSQIIKIALQNQRYLNLQSIHTRNQLINSQTILSFKQLIRKIYNIRQSACQTLKQHINTNTKQSFLRRFVRLITDDNMTREEISLLEDKYMIYNCTESQHIKATNASFLKLATAVNNNNIDNLGNILERISQFMNHQYQQLIIQRIKTNN